MIGGIFLDRDGVINKKLHDSDEANPKNYVLSIDQFEFLPGAIGGLKILQRTGLPLFVVSNQSAVGRGYCNNDRVKGIMDYMNNMLLLSGIYGPIACVWCPHIPEDNCACRKPKPGMIYYLAVNHHIDLSKSWMIGDSVSDSEAAIAAGIPTENILMIDPSETRYVPSTEMVGHGRPVKFLNQFPSLLDAAKHINHLTNSDNMV